VLDTLLRPAPFDADVWRTHHPYHVVLHLTAYGQTSRSCGSAEIEADTDTKILPTSRILSAKHIQ
jgi:hypothetical protein